MSWALALLVSLTTQPTSDLRAPLVDLQIHQQDEAALAALERMRAEDPEAARRLGLDYLRGHLLLRLDRRQEALEAFAQTLLATPALGAYGRFRLAREQEAAGHPEVAAGLTTTLLRANPPRSLLAPATELLGRSIAAGGDCRLLRDLAAVRLPEPERRRLGLTEALCARRGGDPARAETLLVDLLEKNRKDEVARLAAETLVASGPVDRPARQHLLIGLTFYEHREFGIAIEHLARTLIRRQGSSDIRAAELFELRYALGRSYFWRELYRPAAATFATLARGTANPAQKSKVLYQQGRCLELEGWWDEAATVYRQAFALDPQGDWADSALIGELRLRWRRGQERDALVAYQDLVRYRHLSAAGRALMFLASSDLVQGRSDRAGAWLATAGRLHRVAPEELAYWQGRLEELEGHPEGAVDAYLDTLREDPYQPLAEAARRRLRGHDLVPRARALADRLAGSSTPEDLRDAWLLLPPGAHRAAVAARLAEALGRDRLAAPFLDLRLAPPEAWPLWQSPSLGRPEEMLLALGLFDEASSVILRHFPVTQPGLAFTGSLALARSGETRRALYIAEILDKRIPRRVPAALLPLDFRRLLYPYPYRDRIEGESGRREVDPYLLAAIIREESRFDPRAFSAASARGLTQFVFPTARTIAADAGLDPIEPADLENPEISITLGAAYLAALGEHFHGDLAQVVAAYNAGEPQAAHWRAQCYSDEPEEYLTKVSFRETRNYLRKVLTSRAQYLELYPPSRAD